MKILYVVPSLIQSGPVNVVMDLVHVMIEHGHTCEIAYFDDRTDQPINQFPCRTFNVSEIEWTKYDIVHTHGFRPNLLARRKMPHHLRHRLVTTLHNLVFEDNRMRYGAIKGWAVSQLELWAVSAHRRVIVLTEVARKYYNQHLLPERLFVCYNTRILEPALPDKDDVDLINDFKKKSNIQFLLGSHCWIAPRKGLEQLIKVLPVLSDYGLIIIGEGPHTETLQSIAKNIGVSERILWLGRRAKAYRYVPLLDLYVLPSRSEGFPLSLLEVAALGKAAVSSDIDVFRSTFPEPHILPKFPLDDINSLAICIKQAMAKRKELGKNIKMKFDSEFSPEIFYQQHIAVYTAML